MKRSDTYTPAAEERTLLADLLLWATPLLLIVPNIALDFTEIRYTALECIINILVPAGAYLCIMALWRRTGITTLCLIPIMVLCSFQIVLLFLYGESIIAIDMFLNVLTTNVSEASELLLNLASAIIAVLIIYLPLVGIAIAAILRKSRTGRKARRAALFSGSALLLAGMICLGIGLGAEDYRPARKLFPVNVIRNIVYAVERSELSARYNEASASFRFDAHSLRHDSVPEVYLLVIGETSRADNWQLNGYRRPTNPRLSRRTGLVNCPKALSESNTTHKSVPLMMSHLDAHTFGDSIYSTRGIIDAFAEAGFRTAWISNQQRNGQLIDFFGERADEVTFIGDDGKHHFDMELCPLLRNTLRKHAHDKLFVVLHTYGSHYNYNERYPDEYGVFAHKPDVDASPANRRSLLDAYDNSIVYVDAVLDSIIATVEECRRPAAMLYLADHGEDIYDDARHRFLHASPTPTYWQIHVPMLMWMSEEYRRAHPDRHSAAVANASRNISSSRSAFHTLLDMAGIESPCFRPEASLCSKAYTEPERKYLNDYNEAVPLSHSGLRSSDMAALIANGISL